MRSGSMEAVLLLFLAAGMMTVVLPELEDLRRMTRQRIRRWKQSFRNEEDWIAIRKEQYEEQILEHVRQLLQMTFSLGTKRSVRAFFLLSAVLAGLVFLLAFRWIPAFLALAAAVCSGFLPYLLLRCMVQERRVESSREGEILVTELLNDYKIHYCNMQEAIETAAIHMEGAPCCRQLLLNLSRGLQKASTAAEVKGLMETFRFAIGTSWAAILATDLYLACSEGMRVTESLSDLAVSMREVRKLEEMNRRENNEARLILKYLVPLGSLMMAAGGVHFFGLTMGEYLRYQFRTGPGITWFLLTLVAYLAAIAVHLLFSRRKFDL